MSTGKIYFKNLDSIRFIAAFMVVLDHNMWPTFDGVVDLKGHFLLRLLNAVSKGDAGVSVFFVLSGFLITYLLISEYQAYGHIKVRNFYIRRVLRIWPLYYAVLFFSFCIYPIIKSKMGIAYHCEFNPLYFLTFLSNFNLIHVKLMGSVSEILPLNITWSVSVEEQFYLFWPLLFTFLPKKTWGYIIVLVIGASVGFRIWHRNDFWILSFSTFSVLVDLATGAFFAYLIKTQLRVRTFFESASTLSHLFFIALSFNLLLWGDLIFPSKLGMAFGHFVLSFSFAIVIAAQAMSKKDSALNLSNLSFANKWGKYTYGIYLLHPIAMIASTILLQSAHIPRGTPLGTFIGIVVTVIITLIMSWVSYEYFESKFLSLKNRFTVIRTRD